MKWLDKLLGRNDEIAENAVSEELVDEPNVEEYRFDKLDEITEMLKTSKHCLIFSCNEDVPNMRNIIFYSSDDDLDTEFELNVKDMIKDDIVRRVTPEEYEKELEHYDQDLANAFKEVDYQIARADSLEAELNYYKAINDPNGMNSNQALFLWNQVLETKRALERFE